MNNRHVDGEDNHLFYNTQILDPEITCLIVKTKSVPYRFHNEKNFIRERAYNSQRCLETIPGSRNRGFG